MRLMASHKAGVVCALGISQTIAWASSYYLPAVLATSVSRGLGISPVWFFAAFTASMALSAIVGPWSGVRIDRFGGRGILISTNIIFAAGLCLMGLCTGMAGLSAAWLLMGIGMGMGLYDSAFATLASIYGGEARTSITGVTLLAGFASTVGWPLSALMDAQLGWRGACFGWAALHLCLALPLNALLPDGVHFQSRIKDVDKVEVATKTTRSLPLFLLGFVFAVTLFSSTAMAVHLPRLLEAGGATSVAAVAAGVLIGPAQVLARVFELAFLRRVSPLASAGLAVLAYPLGAGIFMSLGGPGAMVFTLLHGAGNGILTIARGTLPLFLFGPVGYGLRQGIINFPARVAQAFAPLIFGFTLEVYGKNAIWLTFSLSLVAFAALMALRKCTASVKIQVAADQAS